VNPFIKEKKWNAKDYILFKHDCQDFVAQCITILKLSRKDDKLKNRGNEILFFSPCILKAIYNVEGWSARNTVKRIIQRIPIVGVLV
jgi:hypothetical protein